MYSKNPKNIAYTNQGQDRDHNIYTEEFLGGADTFIYINGERYNDISAIQYSVREQVKPVYGYSSRMYDDIVTGVRIVQGIIKVPVRNTLQNESLTFVPQAESRSENSYSMAPDWVYNYTPQNSVEDSDQQYFSNEIPNAKSKINIINYKKESGMEINSKADFNLNEEIINNVIIEDAVLKYEPNKSSVYIIGEINKGAIVKIISSIDYYHLIEEKSTNRVGYVEKNKIGVL